MDADRAALVRRWTALYRGCGLNPLPSDPRPKSEGGDKKPLVRFAGWWERTAPDDLFDWPASNRYGPPNVQVMTGRFWGLCVLDLDGPEAVSHVETVWPRLPRSWVSYHGGGRGSRHHWFRTPFGAGPRGKSVLWAAVDEETGVWKKHTAIELLCDRSLIMAPPSVHPKSGREYGFLKGRSPFDTPLAAVPDWVWRMPALSPAGDTPTAAPPPVRPTFVPQSVPRVSRGRHDWRHVLDALPKQSVAEGWGLRFARNGSESNGWVSVHDFTREDSNPSARFNVESGRYWRPGMGKNQTYSLFELGVEMGHYPDWQTCLDALASHYHVR